MLPNGSTGQLLDIMDYISNSFMMPFIALLSAIFIGWVMKPNWIVEEMERGGKHFGRKETVYSYDQISDANYYAGTVLTIYRYPE